MPGYRHSLSGLVAQAVGWLAVRLVAGVVRLVARFPRTTTTVLSVAVVVDQLGLPTTIAVLGGLLFALVGWRLAHPLSFRRQASPRIYGWWRR